MRVTGRPARVRDVTRKRVLVWLAAVVLATLGGAVMAVPLTLLVRAWLGDWPDGSWTAVIAIGYVAWAATSLGISAYWLRRQAGR
jgi:hypothetical protein